MSYAIGDSSSNLDQVGLKADQTCLRYLASLDHEDEHVVCSQEADVLQVSYEAGPENIIKESEAVVVCLTNYRILLFPGLIDGSVVCNALDMFPIEDVILVSLPYRCINDVAFRTEDIALHLVSLGTLWLRMRTRSDFCECLYQNYEIIVHCELAVQQIDYEQLVKDICSGSLHHDLVERRRRIWAVQPLLMSAPMLYQALTSPCPSLINITKFTMHFISLSRHVLHVFRSKAEIDAYRFILSKSPSERAQVPEWVEIDLNDCLMSTFRLESEVIRDGIQIQCPNGVLHLIMPLLEDPDPNETLKQWASGIRDRDLQFVNRSRTDLLRLEFSDPQEQKISHQNPIELTPIDGSCPGVCTETVSTLEAAQTKSFGVYDDLQDISLDDDKHK